jgi:membrane protein DedA with SNARE-associated domain
MVRVLAGFKAMLVVAVALHLRHKFHGPAIDYLGLAAAAAASWAGIPGPGEPVLIAESVFAAKHDLDITGVIAVAWAAAAVGGVIGWLAGMKAGRAVVTIPGPLHRARVKAVQRGEEVFGRHPVWAIVLTPSWVAGIHRVGPSVYLPVNAASAGLMWAVPIGLGGYFAGPPIVDLVNDAGWVLIGAAVVLVALTVGAGALRHRSVKAREST